MDTYEIAPELWFGAERRFDVPGDACVGEVVLSRPIHIKHVPGSGWKFDVITAAELEDRHAIGEIITNTYRTNRDPYASLTYLPTLLSSGLKAGDKIETNMHEFLFYMEFLYMVREKLMHQWPTLKLSEHSQNQLEEIIKVVRGGLQHRRTDLVIAAAAKQPSVRDGLGRPNPRAASAKLAAMHRRLEAQVTLEGRGAESMRKRRRFAAILMRCYSQDIWDMRFLKGYSTDRRGQELQRRIDRAMIKPMLFAGLYCRREFGIDLGHPLVLPRVIEVFTAEMQLMAIRDLFAGLEAHPSNQKETLYKLRVLLAMAPNESLYLRLFKELKDIWNEIGKAFPREPETVKKLAIEAKTSIRDRASDDPNHPWFVQAGPVPRP